MAKVSTGPRAGPSHSETAGSDSTSRAPPATASPTQPMSGSGAGLLGDRGHEILRHREEMGRGEQYRQRRGLVPQRRPRLRDRPGRRHAGIRGQDEGCSSLHQPRLSGGSFAAWFGSN
jgi:hypothetical protein